MKKTLRLLSVLLVMAMMVSSVAFAATFSDVSSDKNYYESVSVLSALGIINGYNDGTFGPEKNVTRAEFSAMLMRALASGGVGDPDPAGMPFVDLGGATWAISDIRTAYDLGIINGMSETTFEPNSNVTYEQALKMVVCALNYGEHALQMQSTMPAGMPWYSGYMQVAGDLGLVDGVNYVLGQPAKRWEIAQIIYNAFDVYLLKKVEMSTGEVMYQQTSDTILNSKLNVARSHGEILADGSSTLAADGSVARNGYALIYESGSGKTVTYAKNGVGLDGLLGKSIEFFYKTDVYGERQLVYILSKGAETSSLKVSAHNLDRVSGSHATGFNVSYYASDDAMRPSSIVLAPNAVVSINGVVKANPVPADFWVENGTLEFITDGGKYSKVSIESIETYVVKSVNKKDRFIIDMLRPAGSNTFYLDYENGAYAINMKNASGNEITVNNLAAKNVLSVKTGQGAAGRIALDVQVCTKTATGTIDELDVVGRTIKVDGKSYKISNYFTKYDTASPSVLGSLGVRDSVKLYFDAYDQVVYAEKIASTSTFYGYLQNVGEDNDGNIKLALISKKVSSIGSSYPTLADNVRINNTVCTDLSDVQTELLAGAQVITANTDNSSSLATYPYTQLIKYTVNSAGLVTEIETATPITSTAQVDEEVFQAYKVGKPMTYDSSSRVFTATDGSSFRINTSTQVYVVPSDRSKDKAYYRRTNTYFTNGHTYTVEPYDIDKSMSVAGAVVVYGSSSTVSAPTGKTSLFIITNISQVGERDYVTGYTISYSGTVKENAEFYTETAGVVNGVYKPGDVISYVPNNDGRAETASILKIMTIDNFTPGTVTKGDRKVHAGLLKVAAEDGAFDVALTANVADCGNASTPVVNLIADDNTKVFTYSKVKDTVTITQGTKDDLYALTSYDNSGNTNATKVLVYQYKTGDKNPVIAVYVIQ